MEGHHVSRDAAEQAGPWPGSGEGGSGREGGAEEMDPGRAARRAARVERKAAAKAQKAGRRARLEGRGEATAGQKQCDLCSQSVDVLIRCQTDASGEWRLVCTKRCWKRVSGGVVDGDADHPHYRYGGLWRNRRAQESPAAAAPRPPAR